MESFDVVAVALRALALVLALQAAGRALWDPARSARQRARPGSPGMPRCALTLLAIALLLLHQGVEAARLGGDWSSLLDMDLQRQNWHGSMAHATVLACFGLAGVWLGQCLPGAQGAGLAWIGAAAVPLSFALTGHTTPRTVPWELSVALVLHCGLIALWLGGVASLLQATKQAAVSELQAEAQSFSRVAGWLVPLILPAGLMLAYGLLPGWSALKTSYGIWLLSKPLLYAVLLLLASINRWRIVPSLDTDAQGRARLRAVLWAEYGLLCATIAATAAATSLLSWQQ